MASALLTRTHGTFNLVGGLWPLIGRRSFERVFGRKADRWLQQTVAGLLVAVGWAQFSAAETKEGRRLARRLGLGTAAALLAIDLRYAPSGRIPRTYLLDAALEAALLAAWSLDALSD
ncbi:hypothetical protein ORV05_23465 [Amycolatopsis cynarae]|uniref:DUF4345 domain-containing protein n=1 Tax=Amycolatopsis cynarae TaxID=2995223 RepID=A0ABY7AZB8_9PSEU|nr:hypothetical protein [Amycolatopsis sp. HUAS 11-8]WAL63938.1 hypothetical protein ORV05_23465 [Amycolatopsis sp. HUAS 11-8]